MNDAQQALRDLAAAMIEAERPDLEPCPAAMSEKAVEMAKPDSPLGRLRDAIADAERTARNRDMWRGQCERQAAELERLRAQVAPAVVAAYRVGDGMGAIKVERVQQMEGPDLWAARRAGDTLSVAGEWEWEPMPSSRDDDYLARCRFTTHTDAISAAVRALSHT